jgi:catechol 2,3-dioxygenase-like lactoylglutathione lyase family enzyme
MVFGDRRNYGVTVGSLHHVELYVSDLNRSVAFWSRFFESLGYELYQSWEQGRSWKLNDTYIGFVQSELRFLDVPYHRCRVGLNHLAFHARSRKHADEVTVELRRRQLRGLL